MSLRQATRIRLPHSPRPPITLPSRHASARNTPPRGGHLPPPKLGLRRGSLAAQLRSIDSWEARRVSTTDWDKGKGQPGSADERKWPAGPSWRDIVDLAHPPRIVRKVKLVHSEADDPGHNVATHGPRKPISTVVSPFFHLRAVPSLRSDAARRLAQSAADGGAIKISMLPIATKTGVSKLAVERKHARGRFLKAANIVLNHTGGRLPVVSGWAYTVVLNERTYNAPFAELCAAIESAFTRCGEDKDAAVEADKPNVFERRPIQRYEEIQARSTTTRAAPTTTRPAPTTTRPAPTTTRPAPKTTKPAPTTTGSGKIMLRAKPPLLRRGALSLPKK
ncbi:uncharacterized protein LOC62_05G006745 [Vanrija pseudolonga]|uniref:Uncharacterized protein n=1 Tax=Vanrija pseudolonga TaxID=143232 RepID=A0AAF0YC32_9TREE|nr:hypothetical protein LOC62_05G006745 [Vanrija pseudolonga]